MGCNEVAYALKTPCVIYLGHILELLPSSTSELVFELEETSHWNLHGKMFLTQWPWHLTYDLDFQPLLRYPSTWHPCQISGSYVCPFSCECETHGHTDTRCKNYYTGLWQFANLCNQRLNVWSPWNLELLIQSLVGELNVSYCQSYPVMCTWPYSDIVINSVNVNIYGGISIHT